MPELVTVSNVERLEELKTYLNELFEKGKYAEITQAIGMHSILIDPEHMAGDQDHLYRLILNLLKKKINREHPKQYSAWITAFPSILDGFVKEGRIITDQAAQTALASRTSAFGAFTSLDEFYEWALEDRRLTLAQIVRYVEATLQQLPR